MRKRARTGRLVQAPRQLAQQIEDFRATRKLSWEDFRAAVSLVLGQPISANAVASIPKRFAASGAVTVGQHLLEAIQEVMERPASFAHTNPYTMKRPKGRQSTPASTVREPVLNGFPQAAGGAALQQDDEDQKRINTIISCFNGMGPSDRRILEQLARRFAREHEVQQKYLELADGLRTLAKV